MAVRWLGGTHGQAVGMRSEGFTNGTRFHGIIDLRARAMGVDVADLDRKSTRLNSSHFPSTPLFRSVELTARRSACAPKVSRMARFSMGSLICVPEPWALM